jgi:DHA2 family methylenomycin A resistance protein-like MFS transporter
LGQSLAIASLATATFALVSSGRPQASTPFEITLGAGFVAVERWRPTPMLPLDLLLRPGLGWVALVGLLHNIGVYGLVFVLSLSFQQLHGMSPLAEGLAFVPMTLALALGTRVGANLLHRFGPIRPLIWGHTVACAGAAALAAIGLGDGTLPLLVPLCAIGGGAGITTPSMSLARTLPHF